MAKVDLTSGSCVVDGNDISRAVRGYDVSFDANVSPFPKVVVHLSVYDIHADGEATLSIPEWAHNALVAFGWTPPSPKP